MPPTVVPDATPAERQAEQDMQVRMREYFASQPKVSIKTREDQWVQVNGYTFIIKGGERVDVPEDVFKLLDEAGRI